MAINIQKIMEAVKDPARLAEISRELAQSGAAPQSDQILQMAGVMAQAEVQQVQAPQQQAPAQGQVTGGQPVQQPNGANALIDPNIAIQQQGVQGFNPNIIPNAPSNPTADLGTLIRGS